MSDVDATQLFEAFGFELQDNGVWRYFKSYDLVDEMKELMKSESDVSTTLLLVEQKPDGRFFGYVVDGASEPTGDVEVPDAATYYPSRDPRDMIALAFDCDSNAYSNATFGEVDGGFSANGWYVNRPFRTEYDLFDFTYTDNAKGPLWRLRAPTVEWGGAYLEWRDELCERLLEQTISPSI